MTDNNEGVRKGEEGMQRDQGKEVSQQGLDGCTLVTLNCNGLGEEKKRRKLKLSIEEIAKNNRDTIIVISLQETHIKGSDWMFKNLTGENQRWSEVNSREGGVAMMMVNVREKWNKEWKVTFEVIIKGLAMAMIVERKREVDGGTEEQSGKIDESKRENNRSKTIIVNIYATPDKRQEILEEAVKWIQRKKEDSQKCDEELSVNIVGDLNIVADVSMDRGGEQVRSKVEERIFRKFCSDVGVEDSVRRWLGKGRKVYTFVRRNGESLQCSRIDHVLLDKQNRAKKVNIQTVAFSDHKIVMVECQIMEKSKPPYWILNRQLLSYCREEVEEILLCWKERLREEKRKKNYKYIKHMWEKMKAELRKIYTEIGKDIGKVQKEEKEAAIKEMEEAEEMETENRDEKERARRYKTARDKLKQIEDGEAEKANKRRRKRWLLESNRSSKFMFRLVANDRGGRAMGAVKRSDGVIVEERKEVAHEVANFYDTLFSSDETVETVQTRFFEENADCLPKINEETAKEMEEPIKIEEILRGISLLGGGKSPGSDGIVIEFYKEFAEVMADILLVVFEAIQVTKGASSTLREAIIILLYKKEDPREIKNWRPISLLNNDYKILTRVLATRLQRCFDEVVDHSQTNGSGRNIVNSVVMMKRLMEDVNVNKWIVVFFDQEKAFDRINHGYLVKVLERMGFGERWIGWIKVLYRDAFCRVNVNGELTRKIVINTGVRQGDPISPMLYVLALEPLLRVLRKKTIGVELHGIRIHYNAYADDIATVSASVEDAENSVRIINEFVKVANAKINMDKCERIHDVSIDVSKCVCLSVIKYVEEAKYLGCILSPNKKTRNNSNRRWWNDRIEKIREGLNRWKGCGLDIKGRIIVSKAVGMGKAMYHVALMAMERDQVEELQKVLDEFVWMEKRPWMRKKERYRPKINGGLGCVHVQSMIDAMKGHWVVRILHPNHSHPVFLVAMEEIKECVRKDGLEIDVVVDQSTRLRVATGLSETFVDLLEAKTKIKWEEYFRPEQRRHREELWATRLWRNPKLANGRSRWSKIAWDAGYHRVGDLVEDKDGQPRWIRIEDVRKWTPEAQVQRAWRAIEKMIEEVKDVMDDAPLARAVWVKGDLLARKGEPEEVLQIERIVGVDMDHSNGNGGRQVTRAVISAWQQKSEAVEERVHIIDSSRMDRIALCGGQPIGVMERTPLNPDNWRTKLLDEGRCQRWIEMPQATVKALYQALLVSSKAVEDLRESLVDIKWQSVWDPWMITKHQIWVFRYLHDRLFTGNQMAHAGAHVCVLGCGEATPDSRHYTRSCVKWDWLWMELKQKWRSAAPMPEGVDRKKKKKISNVDCQRMKRIVMISVSYTMYRYTLKAHFEQVAEMDVEDVRRMLKTEMEAYKLLWRSKPRLRDVMRTYEAIVQ